MLILTGLAAALFAAASIVHVLLRRRIPQLVEEDSVWAWLTSRTPWSDDRFDIDSTAALPATARRFLSAAVDPGSAKRTVIEAFATASGGWLWPGAPAGPLRLHQVMAVPYGGLWKYVSAPLPLLSGSAAVSGGHQWHRQRMFGLLPLRVAKRSDVLPQHLWLLMLSQAAFWSPGALFPSAFVTWEDHGAEAACTVTYKGYAAHLRISLDDDGRPRLVTASSDRGPEVPLVVQLRPVSFAQVDGRSVAIDLDVQSTVAATCRVRLDHLRCFESWDQGPRL